MKAYAISYDGRLALMFENRNLRDFFISEVDGFDISTYAEFREVERLARDRFDEWGNTLRSSGYVACDMSIPEYWDGWWDVFDKAIENGLI